MWLVQSKLRRREVRPLDLSIILTFMQRLVRPSRVYPFISANKSFFASIWATSPVIRTPFLSTSSASCFHLPKSQRNEGPVVIRYMSDSASVLADEKQMEPRNDMQQLELLDGVEDMYGGITIGMEKPMDSNLFASLLSASVSQWRQQGKKAVWIKLPIEHANLVEAAVKEGFRYHHAEPDYLMLVNWICNSVNTLPANASHRVGIGAFVMNDKRQVLVVQEKSGKFKGTGVWKFPTGVVDEGEDICAAAIREVKEETGIDTEFLEVLAFRQSHKSFFRKSDMFFLCMLRPRSFDIQKQDLEIEAAKWMPIESYASQPFIQEHGAFSNIAEVCLKKAEKDYFGFSAVPTTTASGKMTYLYFNTGI